MSTWFGGPKHTRVGHSPLIKSKGKERRGGQTRKGFTSGRPTPEGHQTNISKMASKVPRILTGFCEEMWEKGG